MTKQTSLAATVARQEQERKLAADKEDVALASSTPPDGMVWVRLVSPFYDSAGVYHEVGKALLKKGSVPKSAKVLSEPAKTPVEPADEDE